MLSGALARRYAQALFEIASETSLDQVEAELKALTGLVRDNEDVAKVLHHPHISLTEKKSLMDKLLAGQVGPTVLKFLYLLIDRRRQNLLSLIEREFGRFADEARQITEAKVASATALTPNQEERLKERLEKMTGKNVRLVAELRPELIGGVMVQIGDMVMDGTVAHALDRMRQELSKNTETVPQGIGVK